MINFFLIFTTLRAQPQEQQRFSIFFLPNLATERAKSHLSQQQRN